MAVNAIVPPRQARISMGFVPIGLGVAGAVVPFVGGRFDAWGFGLIWLAVIGAVTAARAVVRLEPPNRVFVDLVGLVLTLVIFAPEGGWWFGPAVLDASGPAGRGAVRRLAAPMTSSELLLPTLTDGHVLLRAAESRDLPAIEAGMHDPDVIRWIGPPELSAQDVLVQIDERWSNGSPTFAICELDGTLVGKLWLDVREGDAPLGYVGYWLLPVGRGRGLATSAVRLLTTWAVQELGITSFRLTTAPDNPRSQRVAERNGFRRVDPAAESLPVGPEDRGVVFSLDATQGPSALEGEPISVRSRIQR